MRGKLVSTNEVISAVICIEEAQNYISDLPYHTLFVYETLGIHGIDKANQLVITILKQYEIIRSKMKSIEHMNICPEFNDNTSIILHDANKNINYFLDVLNRIKDMKEEIID
ncbi:MAG: hypothetical protein JJT76_00470 [Clostridiaceae bacterium]|nr:hypothetical protein [Clostridiaceae bacterium]